MLEMAKKTFYNLSAADSGSARIVVSFTTVLWKHQSSRGKENQKLLS